ncbi:heterokaryon incompatibility protein-domain-containing protein [Leptodontidium sp. 2 PMI_412]|nr:heterokaryon incompatibility protein-domain-containing protein [Leptodontidium sp. 2 PMI_412]
MDIEAEFDYHRLEDHPAYDAISYVWGTNLPRNSRLILHGKQFLITQRVHDILDSIGSSFGTRDIWIDCICTSQDDTGEKKHQIPKMVEVYKNAVYVRAFLQGRRIVG